MYDNKDQKELIILPVQFRKRTKDADTKASCAGNAKRYYSEHGNSWFNNRENDDVYFLNLYGFIFLTSTIVPGINYIYVSIIS